MIMKVDHRKKITNLLKEVTEYIDTQYDVLMSLENPSQFEKGKIYSFLEMKTIFGKLVNKERN
jgi:hypothetical protein